MGDLGVIARHQLVTQYAILSIRTFSERQGGAPQMDVQWGHLVTPYPPWGAAIAARSQTWPFDVVVAIGEGFELDSSPELVDMDREWAGVIPFADASVDVQVFGGVVPELSELPIPGPGDHPMRVSWRYTKRKPADEYDAVWIESVIIRIDEPNQAAG